MKFYSPLRYPGGKNKLAKFIALICEKNNINGHYVEPYAGGASVALYLLLEGLVSKITINDKDHAVYAFWHSVLNETDALCREIRQAEVTIANWKKQREVQKNKNSEMNLVKLGFSTLFLNRTNYSGVIDGGVIGGLDQSGPYKLDCRFNKKELIKRIQLIAAHKRSIQLKNLDALELINEIDKNPDTIFYFDPPYYLKGPSLYMNHYKQGDHKKVSEKIKKIKNARWIVSYDNVTDIKAFYSGAKMIEYSLLHTAREVREGKEVLFFSDNLFLPRVKNPVLI